MAVLNSSDVKFTLLDIHSESIESVNRVIRAFDLGDHVEGICVTDAAQYKIDVECSPDTVLIEMMRARLETEPQVAVATHLMRQAPEAVLIPEEIRIDLALVNSSSEFKFIDPNDENIEPSRHRVLIGPALVLNKATITSWNAETDSVGHAVLEIPEFDSSRYRPMLLTTVSVYRGHVLQDYDAGITCPRPLSIDGTICPGTKVEFRYELGNRPRLAARVSAD